VKLNKVEERVTPMLGDASKIIKQELHGKADRVLMPLPERAKEYIDDAVAALKDDGGIIHYFTHIGSDSKNDALKACAAEVEGIMKTRYSLEDSRVVREVGPRFYQVVADLRVIK
jgi:tRNA (guanine37-N1)-methyltransferase